MVVVTNGTSTYTATEDMTVLVTGAAACSMIGWNKEQHYAYLTISTTGEILENIDSYTANDTWNGSVVPAKRFEEKLIRLSAGDDVKISYNAHNNELVRAVIYRIQ